MDFNLEHLRAFICVARLENLSAAAKELGATQPNLGRQMTALQKQVRLSLFSRHSRGIRLTKQGEEFLRVCEDIVGQLAQRTDLIREKDSAPEGTLKIVTGVGTTEAILDNLPQFSQKFPKVDFSFLSTTEIYQFLTGDADVGIIPISYSDPEITQHLLYELNLRIYASPKYLKEHSTPKSLEDLNSHKLIVYSGGDRALEEINIHLYKSNKNLHPFIKVNNGISLRKALLNGLGIGPYGYEENLVKTNFLVDLFPDMADHKIPYYFTYHRRLEGSPKVQAFHEFMNQIAKIWQRPIL